MGLTFGGAQLGQGHDQSGGLHNHGKQHGRLAAVAGPAGDQQRIRDSSPATVDAAKVRAVRRGAAARARLSAARVIGPCPDGSVVVATPASSSALARATAGHCGEPGGRPSADR
ncbi:hypothetical protein GCM10029963_78100 [Micromonospora andamanensis]